ncbi:flagellum-specific ATP synthase [Halobacillus andaensis]|uniref:Flagellum-specific ATP synthase n=1 Tax=Halobacillus andaensis TaxID=1176239 RepID=A0A917EVD9_HALAA|nr:flagellar protein export ATPase FliI [Halobacillus andaensis]MBP2003494.1 flagellum-specific ATP synthase [Halobacillus andaensis]GGF11038.1 flagellum-specific ATP synthase [Halobacillus andaensis]
MNKELYLQSIRKADTYKRFGKITRVIGLMVESKGPEASVGDVCYIHTPSSQSSKKIAAEVVGFQEEKLLLMPYSELKDIGPGSLVEATKEPLQIKAGIGLIGQVINPMGELLSEDCLPKGLKTYPTEQSPPNPLTRPPISKPIQVGVRAIDTLLTVGEGQRIGIFAGSGVGKSTLLGMMSRNSSADINVIALIGERGREVREFIENDLGKEGLKRSIVVVATSDQPALMRVKGAYTATAISEYFRERGYNVNLLMDSITRFAMAQREIGLAAGEPPTTKGYTPSVFATLPKLLERTGKSHQGSVTAYYTVLVDGDDLNEPISDTVRGILDGHIVLDRKLAEQGQFPAINILKSISRVMNQVVDDTHKDSADRLRQLLATYEDNSELIQIGAYKRGSSREIDEAIHYQPAIINFLKQDVNEKSSFQDSVKALSQLLA